MPPSNHCSTNIHVDMYGVAFGVDSSVYNFFFSIPIVVVITIAAFSPCYTARATYIHTYIHSCMTMIQHDLIRKLQWIIKRAFFCVLCRISASIYRVCMRAVCVSASSSACQYLCTFRIFNVFFSLSPFCFIWFCVLLTTNITHSHT